MCPCDKSNRDGKFVPFENHEYFGYCHSCDKTFLPEREERFPRWKPKEFDPGPVPIQFIPDFFLIESLGQDNLFTEFLFSRFDIKKVGTAIKQYEIGTWQTRRGFESMQGAVCFWQIDKNRNVRQVKAMKYDPVTGKRVKEKGSYILGKLLLKQMHIDDPNLKQCFFGEHLLNEFPGKVIGVVESEKTAIIASIMIPEVLWLGTGGANGCSWDSKDIFRVLTGRKVVFYPDNDQIEAWSKRIKDNKLTQYANISICTEFHNQRKQGQEKYDLADYLLGVHVHARNEHDEHHEHII